MIINFLLDKIYIERKNTPKSNIEAKNTLRVLNITEETLEPLSKEKILRFNFVYNVSYEPQIAFLEMTGNLSYKVDEKKQKEILNEWNKEKKINQSVSSAVFNHILSKCSVKALRLAQELNLPPHIPFPRVALKTEQAKKVVTYDLDGNTNGFLIELLKDGEKTATYLTAAQPGAFKGYHLHKVRASRYVCIKGKMKVILYVKGVREEHILDGSNPTRLYIPKNIPTGLENVGDEEAWLINFPDPFYDPSLKDEQVDFTQEELEQGKANEYYT